MDEAMASQAMVIVPEGARLRSNTGRQLAGFLRGKIQLRLEHTSLCFWSIQSCSNAPSLTSKTTIVGILNGSSHRAQVSAYHSFQFSFCDLR